MQDSNLMSQYADPELIATMELGDRLIGALMTTVMGMGITIIVLIIIWIAIICMTKILNRESVGGKKGSVNGIEIICDEEDDEEELVAVIMAALAAANENKKEYSNLKLKQIKRVHR